MSASSSTNNNWKGRVNLSLQGGQVPDRFKVGVIKPLLKKERSWSRELFKFFGQYRICIFYLKSRRNQLQHNYIIILMVTRVYFKNFNQRINDVITALKSHLSESIMTFWKLLTTTNLLFCYCLTNRLHLILSITRSWYLDWRIVSALWTMLLKLIIFSPGANRPDLAYFVRKFAKNCVTSDCSQIWHRGS